MQLGISFLWGKDFVESVSEWWCNLTTLPTSSFLMARDKKWQCAEFFLSFPAPFLVVLLECGCSRHLILNFVLCMCFWIPGVLHAMYFAVRRRPEVESIQFRDKSSSTIMTPNMSLTITPSTTPIPSNQYNVKDEEQ